MFKLLKSLDRRLKVNQAGTGTIYITFDDKKIRISNHEPNESMRRFRGEADLEIYTHDVVGKEINSKYDVIEKVSSFYNIEIPRGIKSAITRHKNAKYKEAIRIAEVQKSQKIFNDEVQEKLKIFHKKIKSLVRGREKELKKLLDEADKYGDLGSNGDKRRKRRVSYFKREFKNRFGIEATPGDVDSALMRA